MITIDHSEYIILPSAIILPPICITCIPTTKSIPTASTLATYNSAQYNSAQYNSARTRLTSLWSSTVGHQCWELRAHSVESTRTRPCGVWARCLKDGWLDTTSNMRLTWLDSGCKSSLAASSFKIKTMWKNYNSVQWSCICASPVLKGNMCLSSVLKAEQQHQETLSSSNNS
jgi:hypothetical protein